MHDSNHHWPPATQPGALTYRAHRLFLRVGEPRLSALGVGIAHFPVLSALRDGKQLSQKDLAEFAQTEQPTMAQTLARMERDGLIQRHPHPEDKRSSLISLTPQAIAKTPQVMEVLMQGNREALQGFTPEEETTLIELLKRVITNLENASEKKTEA